MLIVRRRTLLIVALLFTVFHLLVLIIIVFFSSTTPPSVQHSPLISYSNERNNLTLCSMLRDEMPDILEWIEYNRLQGVDRFMLYDDESSDDTLLIPTLYRLRGLDDLIEFYPANPYRYNVLPPHQAEPHHFDKEGWAIDHCSHRSVNRSKWVMAVDMDEFMYSATYPTVWHYLESIANQTDPTLAYPVSQVDVLAVRFGTFGLEWDFEGSANFNPLNDSISVSVNNPNNNGNDNDTAIYPLFIELNPNRAPHPHLDSDYDARYNETCRNHQRSEACDHAIGKAIWKPERCDAGAIHWCQNITRGHWIWAHISDLRLYHYALKSRAHVHGLLDVLREHKALVYNAFDESWFSSRHDPLPERMTRRVHQAIDYLLLDNT